MAFLSERKANLDQMDYAPERPTGLAGVIFWETWGWKRCLFRRDPSILSNGNPMAVSVRPIATTATLSCRGLFITLQRAEELETQKNVRA